MKSSSYHQAVLESMNEPVYVRDKDKNILYFNKAAEKLTGWPLEEGRGRKCYEIFGDREHRCKNVCPVDRVIETGEPLTHHEGELITREGAEKRMRVMINPLREEGKITGGIVIMEDVSEFRKLEETHTKTLLRLEQSLEETRIARDELSASRDVLVEAQRIGRMGSWIWDGTSDTARCSEEYFRLLGLPYNSAGLPKNEFYGMVHPDDRERMISGLEDAVRDRTRYDETYRIYLKDGSERIHNAQAEVVYDETGGMKYIIGIQHDITELKRAEKALEESEKRYRSIIQASLDGFIRCDMTGRIREVNRAYCRMSGYGEAELLEMGIGDLEEQESAGEISARIARLIETGSDLFETVHRRKDGSFLELDVVIQLLEGGGEFVTFLKDITEKKQISEQLRQAQKLESIGSLAGGVAHDFNNILTPVMGMAELLMGEMAPGSPDRALAGDILEAAERGAELVKQILAFSRKSTHKISSVSIQDIIGEVCKLARASIPAGIILDCDVDPACGPVKADPTQIHQVVMNMVTNAYHAVEATGGEIFLGLKEIEIGEENRPSPSLAPGPYVHIMVSDNGVGMSSDVMGKIFDPYFTTKELGKGTGLGLAVVYGIVKEHGGEITVESEEGGGTVFHVWLPRV